MGYNQEHMKIHNHTQTHTQTIQSSTIHSRIERKLALLSIREVIRTQTISAKFQEMVTIIVTRSNMKTINLQTREGNVDGCFFLDLETDLGTNWDRFIECELYGESDGLPGSKDYREGFYTGHIYSGGFSRSITKSVLQLVNLDIPGSGQC